MKAIQNEFKTKKDFQDCMTAFCENLTPFFTADRAHIKLGANAAKYDEGTAGLEGFSRLLWGLIPLWAGSGSDALADYIRAGIENGTDPAKASYWGDLCDGHQAFVEMTPMALGLLLTPQKFWEPLPPGVKENFCRWLLRINDFELAANNWLLFRVLVNIGLKKAGARYSQSAIDGVFQTLETFYLGGGWYADGRDKRIDYYIAWAIHFYSLIYAKFMEDDDPPRCRLIRERARLFAGDFIYWFTGEGAGIPFGRSLTYRFAQCAFWSAMAFADEPFTGMGTLKGLVARNFRDWLKKPVLDAAGILTIGYGYPNINMAEAYNSPSSPMWALKSFLILALPEDHPFWTEPEKPLPALEKTRTLKHPMMVIQRKDDGDVIALTSGQYPAFDPTHTAEKYAKFAYSAFFSFNVPRSYHTLSQASPDNMLAFVIQGMYFVRRTCESVEVTENRIRSTWSPARGVSVQTVLEPRGNGHTRTHRVTLDFDCDAVECGFALPVDNYRTVEKILGEHSVTLRTAEAESRITLEEGTGEPGDFLCEPNTNLTHPRTALPFIAYHFNKGTHIIKIHVECTRYTKTA
jgi:hypothetical protein